MPTIKANLKIRKDLRAMSLATLATLLLLMPLAITQSLRSCHRYNYYRRCPDGPWNVEIFIWHPTR